MKHDCNKKCHQKSVNGTAESVQVEQGEEHHMISAVLKAIK
jgi:hypothetical protein